MKTSRRSVLRNIGLGVAAAGSFLGITAVVEAKPKQPEGGPTFEELVKEYGFLPPEQLEFHYLAAKQAVLQSNDSFWDK